MYSCPQGDPSGLSGPSQALDPLAAPPSSQPPSGPVAKKRRVGGVSVNPSRSVGPTRTAVSGVADASVLSLTHRPDLCYLIEFFLRRRKK